MGCDVSYFMDTMEMAELRCWVESYNEQLEDHKNEHRLLCHSVYNAINLSNGGHPLDVTKIFRYPWDDASEDAEPWSMEEMKALGQQFKQALDQHEKSKKNE